MSSSTGFPLSVASPSVQLKRIMPPLVKICTASSIVSE